MLGLKTMFTDRFCLLACEVVRDDGEVRKGGVRPERSKEDKWAARLQGYIRTSVDDGEKKGQKKCSLESVLLNDTGKSEECCADATFGQQVCAERAGLR